MGHIVLASLAALFAGAAAAAQQRAPTFFVVTGTDGKPRAGAEVTCVVSSDAMLANEADVQRATTDERGRARCQLLVGRLYETWAITAPAANGSAFVSAIAPHLVAGQVIELRTADARAPRRVHLPGFAAWRLPEASKLRWYPVAGIDLSTDLPLPADDAIDAPVSPLATGCLCVLDAANAPLVTTNLLPAAEAVVDFPAPRRITVRVIDDHDAPIAGATIEYQLDRGGEETSFVPRHHSFHRTVGVTDARGMLECLVPRLDVGDVTLFAGKSGWAWLPQRVLGDEPMTFCLREALRTTVRVTGRKGPGISVSANGAFAMPEELGGRRSAHSLRTLAENDGSWTVEHASSQFTLCVRTPESLPLEFAIDNAIASGDVIDADLSDSNRIDAQVLDAAGGLTACAVAVGGREHGNMHWITVLATGLSGKLRLSVPAGDFVLYATTGTNHALALVDRTRRTPHELRLEPVPTMQVRVKDRVGNPVAGATATLKDMSFAHPHGEDLQAAWCSVAASRLRMDTMPARTNDDGVMQVPALLYPEISANMVVTHGTRTSQPFRLMPGETAEVTID